ncbi:hypothetical protein T492DRAFT_958775 [Pavlovales sp. CCMP2436]|nr:hypothetical protein T492DRAFT_958775 [Pavlovales sp. CCMP2436]
MRMARLFATAAALPAIDACSNASRLSSSVGSFCCALRGAPSSQSLILCSISGKRGILARDLFRSPASSHSQNEPNSSLVVSAFRSKNTSSAFLSGRGRSGVGWLLFAGQVGCVRSQGRGRPSRLRERSQPSRLPCETRSHAADSAKGTCGLDRKGEVGQVGCVRSRLAHRACLRDLDAEVIKLLEQVALALVHRPALAPGVLCGTSKPHAPGGEDVTVQL